MDDLQLVQIMESEIKNLSSRGKEVWELAESAADLNEPGASEFIASLPDISERMQSLDRADFYTIKRLIKLQKGRRIANAIEEKCIDKRLASERRWKTLIETAYWKDKEAGRPIDLDMNGSQAVHKLAESS